MATSTIAVTGATGFIGRAVCRELVAHGYAVRALVRRGDQRPAQAVQFVTGDLERAEPEVLTQALDGAAAVVHLAGRAHVQGERAPDPAAAYDAANREATDRLAAAAAQARVSRFVFASSVKVNGEASAPGRPFRPDDPPAPADLYARSKLAAEAALAARCQGSATETIVLRLPLVYGPGVGANFLRLMDAVANERVLPVGAIDNRRSLLYVGNLADAVLACLEVAVPPAGIHALADRESVSTPDLVRALGSAMGKAPRMLAIPEWLLRFGGAILGRRADVERLCGSLEVDASGFARATGWQARFTLAQGLAATATWWRARHSI